MCGIVGKISINTAEVNTVELKKMTDVLQHRGPDGVGHWISACGKVGLGHTRLSIIDLAATANQPMHYLGRYSIVFNGEIYNYIELKQQLVSIGYTFRTNSDTEVLLALFDKYRESCLQMLDGMFAFTIFDAQEQLVFCARDRFGEKPFFYNYTNGRNFSFASEMKALWAVGVNKEVNNVMLFNYLADGYTENPDDAAQTFFTSCKKLPHSHYLVFSLVDFKISVTQYYAIEYKNINNSVTEKQAKEKFNELFFTAVKRRLRGDVSVGSSLSGGLDSSLAVCTMKDILKTKEKNIETFSAIFPGFAKNEQKYIDIVVKTAGVTPNYVSPTEEGLVKDIDALLYHQEEPIGSASVYVQYCVMKLAKERNITVLLDGQGADEILGGYHHFYKSYLGELYRTNKSLYKAEIKNYNELHRDNAVNANEIKGIANKLKLFAAPHIPSIKKAYNQIAQWKTPFFNEDFWHTYSKKAFSFNLPYYALNESLYNSLTKGSLQELLRYADRNSMAHSREVRLPFLYHELVDFMFTLPPDFKIRSGWTKWLMREASNDVLPREICWRTDKIGYEAPQKSWMESHAVGKLVLESAEKLISNNILVKSVAKNNLFTHEQNDAKGKGWRVWMAGGIC
jgi:asparagine synthase (glutamine-hydrolysing)